MRILISEGLLYNLYNRETISFIYDMIIKNGGEKLYDGILKKKGVNITVRNFRQIPAVNSLTVVYDPNKKTEMTDIEIERDILYIYINPKANYFLKKLETDIGDRYPGYNERKILFLLEERVSVALENFLNSFFNESWMAEAIEIMSSQIGQKEMNDIKAGKRVEKRGALPKNEGGGIKADNYILLANPKSLPKKHIWGVKRHTLIYEIGINTVREIYQNLKFSDSKTEADLNKRINIAVKKVMAGQSNK
jgi:hypothetical protein